MISFKYGNFQRLQTAQGLAALDVQFEQYLSQADSTLAAQLLAYRANQLSATQASEWIIAAAIHLEQFIAELFGIESAVAALTAQTRSYDSLFESTKKTTRLFHPPQKKDYANLVPMLPVENDPFSRFEGPAETQRERDGFTLTDTRMSLRDVLDEIHYCVYCHKNEGDFCSKGFPVKKSNPELGLKLNPVGDVLTGCPLEEKISEMNVVKRSGFGIAALAIVTIDNPMCAATGHRICNDCMKSCIYQKQDPVNIPQIETRVLTDVLDLPWGVEIYDLLIRFNPLRQTQYIPLEYNNKKVMVMGMGPAGFTVSHHLLMEGCAVVGMDGLKIEPLPQHLIDQPIRDFQSLTESLDDRIMTGFGGVAEYGITVRWDKNFLKLIYLSLARRAHFQVKGNVRFGGTMTVEKAWELGFDHVVIAVGAGLPKELRIPNSLAKGMRQANDFLMALQLTGAVKKSSLANLQVRLPAVVIGGGLTGIDTATEVQAYYIVQVEKIHQRYHILKSHYGENNVRSLFDAESLSILDEFLAHAEKVIAERQKEKPQLNALIREFGGVTVVYRKSIQESPAYQRNHEEVIKALEEGIYYAQGLEPVGVVLDEYGAAKGLTCRSRIQDETGNWMWSDEEKTLPAKSIFVATGAKPNIAYEFEHRGTFARVGDAYAVEGIGLHVKQPVGVMTSNPRVSFIGDTHPVFHGSVVKAIASGKLGYPKIMQALSEPHSFVSEEGSTETPPAFFKEEITEIPPLFFKAGQGGIYADFREKINQLFESHVVSSLRHTDNIVEITVHSPISAAQFHPGQFYRLQNYETYAETLMDERGGASTLQTEAVAALGIVNPANPNELSFFIVEKGVSSKILTNMKRGDPIAIMGPAGSKAKIPATPQAILIIGNAMAIPYLLSVGPALKAGGHTIYFIADVPESERFAMDRITDLATQARFFVSQQTEQVIDEMQLIDLNKIESVFVVGSAQQLKTIQHARNAALKDKLHKAATFTASVYGPMQCMLKGVCAQCLQWQIDPITGKRTKAVYACSWQHQPIEIVDVDNMHDRLAQNKTQEILSDLWLRYLREGVSSAH